MREKQNRSRGEVERLRNGLSILASVAQTANRTVDFGEMLTASLDRIMEIDGVSLAGAFLLDEKQTGVLGRAGFRGGDEALWERLGPLRLGTGEVGEAALDGEPRFIEGPSDAGGLSPLFSEGRASSLIVLPLASKIRAYGILVVGMETGGVVAQSEKELLTTFGQIVGGAAERTSLYSENLRRLEEQKTFYGLGQEIASRLELKVILQKIIDKAVEFAEADSGEIVLWDNRKQGYFVAVVHGLPASRLETEIPHDAEGVASAVLKKKAPVVRESGGSRSRAAEAGGAEGYRSVIGVPLLVREMVIGVMVVETQDPQKQFQQSEIDHLVNFSHQAGVAIGNAKLYEESLEKIRQLTMLFEVGKTLSSTLDPDELHRKALEILRTHFHCVACGILMLDRESRELYFTQGFAKNYDEIRGRRYRLGVDGIAGWVAETGEVHYVPDVTKNSRYLSGSPETRSEVVLPIKVRDEVVGVLDIGRSEVNGFDEEDLKVLEAFSGQMSIAQENARLFSELRATLDELQRAQDRIIQTEKLRALGEMASGVAHDFNNLLAIILGNIELLLLQIDRLTLEEVRDRLRIIERSSRDGAETVRRIQEFSGVRRDQPFTPLSLNELVEDVATITQPRWRDQSRKRGIQIDLETKVEDVPEVLGNSAELREVLANLLFNAVDAMPNGGRIALSTRRQGDCVILTVSDTGTGMPEDVCRKIFDPFFSTKGVSHSGLGMSVSYGIIKRHGGEIEVESEVGRGTSFRISLPVAPKREEPKPVPAAPVQATRTGRVLVIDDDASVRDILTRMLQVRGHQIVTASDGEEGIRRFEENRFDLVFTDLGMPKISGWEVGQAVKASDHPVPVVMITGWGVELDRQKMGENGVDFVVSKPFNFSQVVQVVAEVLEGKPPGSSSEKADGRPIPAVSS